MSALIVVQFETIEEAVDQARRAKVILDQQRSAEAIIWVGRFDDDSRELDQIPEAREMLRTFGDELGTKYIVRFEPSIAAMILSTMDCGVVRVGYDFTFSELTARKLLAACKEWD